MADSAIDEPLHVVMIPWLAFGHMNPLLQLSLSLASAGVRVTYVCTPANTRRLPKVPSNLSPRIRFLELSLPKVDGLPEGGEATVDIAVDQIQYLKVAYDSLAGPLKRFVAEESPDWVIHDVLAPWAPDLGVPSVAFSVYAASSLSFFGPLEAICPEDGREPRSAESLTAPPEWVPFPSKVAFRPFEARVMHQALYADSASGYTDARRYAQTIRRATVLAIRSCPEVERGYMEIIQKFIGKPVVPLGVLPPRLTSPEVKGGDDRSSLTGQWVEVFQWLDVQAPRSVVFVGFGSECKLSREHVDALASGIEASGLPFLWVLRRPTWAEDDADEEGVLPSGFVGRTRGRGVVTMGWAPQLQILAHPVIGGALFHSGWGTVVEVLQHGHVMALVPLVIDQGLIARLLEEKGLGVEVERGKDGEFTGEGVARCLRRVMASEEGERLRARTEEVGAVVADAKVHERYIREFVDVLVRGRGKA